MASWFWIEEPVGFAVFCLLVGVPVALGVSLFLAARYRHAVRLSMRAASGTDEPGAGEPADSILIERPVPLQWVDPGAGGAATTGSGFLAAGRRRRGRMARAVLFAGLAHTCVAATLLLPASEIAFSPKRFLALWLVLAWPVVPSALFVSAGDRRLRLAAPLAFLLVGWMLLPVSFKEFAFLAIWLGGIPMGMAVVMSNHRVRAVAPVVLVAVILVIVAANLALGLAYTALLALEFLPVGPTLALLFVLAIVGAVVGGRAFLRLLARRYVGKKTSDQLLVLNLWWVLYSIWISILLATGWSWGGAAGLLPLTLYFAVLGWRLSAARRKAASKAPRRLLLLRVFGARRRSERLLEDLGRLWRYVGTVELIAGTDLATANLEPHELLEFLGGGLARQFVRDEEDLEERMRNRDDAPDPDGRFRVREFFCHDSTWRATLRRLAGDADAVLMDLRGFSRANKGCEYELGQLLAWVPLGQVVLLVDDTTQQASLQEVLRSQWSRLPVESVNAALPAAQLQVLHVAGQDAASARRILNALGGVLQSAAG